MGKTVREKHPLPRPLLPARIVLKIIEPKSSKDLQRSILKLSYFYLRVLRSKKGNSTHPSRSCLTGTLSPRVLNCALSFTPFHPLLWKLPGLPQDWTIPYYTLCPQTFILLPPEHQGLFSASSCSLPSLSGLLLSGREGGLIFAGYLLLAVHHAEGFTCVSR